MVRYRPDPRGHDFNQLFKWQTTLGMFKTSGFKYRYYKFFDHGLKYPFIMMPTFFAAIFITICTYSTYTGNYPAGEGSYRKYSTAERLFMQPQHVGDRSHLRGEWDNNNYCWRDLPDCGKDFIPRYFS